MDPTCRIQACTKPKWYVRYRSDTLSAHILSVAQARIWEEIGNSSVLSFIVSLVQASHRLYPLWFSIYGSPALIVGSVQWRSRNHNKHSSRLVPISSLPHQHPTAYTSKHSSEDLPIKQPRPCDYAPCFQRTRSRIFHNFHFRGPAVNQPGPNLNSVHR